MPTRPNSARNRSGSLSLELLLVLPILVGILGATIMFGMMLVAQQVLTTASQAGARAAAIGTCADAEPAADLVLGPGKLSAATVSCIDDGTNVSVSVTVPADQVVPNLLKNFGLGVECFTLGATTTMKKE